jgi:hypothetical protein
LNNEIRQQLENAAVCGHGINTCRSMPTLAASPMTKSVNSSEKQRSRSIDLKTTAKKPNVLFDDLADDMGFSDIGCYGSEIETPHIDRLAAAGVRFSQFYTARCSPSRASLLTGLHPHQTGIGIPTKDDRPHGYPGSLNDQRMVAEILSAEGYATSLVGKWHLASNIRR